MLKISGKRTLAQMSGFDFVITIAIGSTFGRLITAKDVSLVESTAAFLLLIFLQVVVVYLDTKFKWFSKTIKSDPSLLFYKGALLYKNINQSKITKNEVLEVIRQHGIESLDEVEAVVLEAAGAWSVVKKGNRTSEKEKSTLKPLLDAEQLKDKILA